jgi:hypothetical protein
MEIDFKFLGGSAKLTLDECIFSNLIHLLEEERESIDKNISKLTFLQRTTFTQVVNQLFLQVEKFKENENSEFILKKMQLKRKKTKEEKEKKENESSKKRKVDQ